MRALSFEDNILKLKVSLGFYNHCLVELDCHLSKEGQAHQKAFKCITKSGVGQTSSTPSQPSHRSINSEQCYQIEMIHVNVFLFLILSISDHFVYALSPEFRNLLLLENGNSL